MKWCVWAEVPERPGYFDCLHCKLPLGHPRGQRGPREYPAKVRRECKAGDDVAPAKSRGLGDTVAKAIHTVTGGLVKPCGGCKKRQEALNKLLPYRDPDPDDGRAG